MIGKEEDIGRKRRTEDRWEGDWKGREGRGGKEIGKEEKVEEGRKRRV